MRVLLRRACLLICGAVCIASVVLSHRSRTRYESACWCTPINEQGQSRAWAVIHWSGRIIFECNSDQSSGEYQRTQNSTRFFFTSSPVPYHEQWDWKPGSYPSHWEVAGFKYYHLTPFSSATFTRNARGICIPLLPLAAFTAAPIGVELVRQVRRRCRVAKGCCRRCGYDLRATPMRCPECGLFVRSSSERPAPGDTDEEPAATA